MDEIKVYQVKRPSVARELLATVFLVGIMIINTLRMNSIKFWDDFIMIFLFCIVIITGLISIIASIYRVFGMKKIIEILIHPDYIVIDNKQFEAKQIKRIYNKGYFGTQVGFKPINRKFVPYSLCFKFLTQKDEDAGMKQLLAWAERSGVNVAQKNFTRLL